MFSQALTSGIIAVEAEMVIAFAESSGGPALSSLEDPSLSDFINFLIVKCCSVITVKMYLQIAIVQQTVNVTKRVLGNVSGL